MRYGLAGTRGLDAESSAGSRALVVDDDPDITRFVGGVLGTRGLTTLAAYDPIQGFLVARQEQPRLILVDWHMPAGGASQLLCRLRDHPRTSAIPVFVITADESPAVALEATALGARKVLRKPLDPAVLLGVAEKLGD